jgi:hypothetical protein
MRRIFEMKTMKLRNLALAVLLSNTLALAQHGHAGGSTGGSMGNLGNSNGMAHEASADNHATLSAAHGKTATEILTKDTKLADKIATLTHQPAAQACSGFKNLGQCVAAAHVAKNLGISFDCLKSDMTGTAAPANASCPVGTGTKSKSMSLGKAIQTLDPKADEKAESRKGESEAQEDLNKS